MYSVWSALAGLAVMAVLIWLGVLTYLILKEKDFLDEIFPKNGERDIRKKFEELIKEVKGSEVQTRQIEKKLGLLEHDGMNHIQRVKLIRFNPYDDTGGDQSFCIALLNNDSTGVVVTSLHGRSGTRIFAKPVEKGKATKYHLSKEEEQTVREALR